MDRPDAPQDAWIEQVPAARLAYPTATMDWFKYVLWAVIKPVHPHVRDGLDRLGLLHPYEHFRTNGRQEYLLGVIAPGYTVEDVASYLVSRGFGNHFPALKDDGELVSLRRTPDFEHQYHIRIFSDGEVRGHYEYTTESHPLMHSFQIGFEPRRHEFLALLGDYITPAA